MKRGLYVLQMELPGRETQPNIPHFKPVLAYGRMKWRPEFETSHRNKVSSDRSERKRQVMELVREDGKKQRRLKEEEKEGTKTKNDVNKWKSSAGHVSRRGVGQSIDWNEN